jgi:hypothetical protein
VADKSSVPKLIEESLDIGDTVAQSFTRKSCQYNLVGF